MNAKFIEPFPYSLLLNEAMIAEIGNVPSGASRPALKGAFTDLGNDLGRGSHTIALGPNAPTLGFCAVREPRVIF